MYNEHLCMHKTSKQQKNDKCLCVDKCTKGICPCQRYKQRRSDRINEFYVLNRYN